MKRKVIFVGEDRQLWPELHGRLAGPESDWEVAFTRTTQQALAAMEQSRFDAVVAEINLPGPNGAELLDQVMQRHPHTLRFIRSEFSASQMTMKCVATAHQHLVKPCGAQTVLEALARAFKFQSWLPSDAVQEVMGQLRQLPSPPKLYFQVVMELQSPEASLAKIGSLVAQDMAMSAKMLQLVNSAVFGLHRQVSDPVEAVLHMGLEMTRSLILLGHTFAYFDQFKWSEFSIDELWRHSFATGKLAQTLAGLENVDPEVASQSFTAGMMHDIGKLALAANLPEQFNAALKLAREQKLQPWEAESEVIGASHAEVGACLLCIWGLPMPIVEAVALHHYPVQLTSNEFCPLAAVHLANVFEHEAQPQQQAGACPSVDAAYLEEMGFSNLIETWRSLCLEKRPTAAA